MPFKEHGKPFLAAEYANDRKFHLLLAASGSVATIKLPNIVQALSNGPSLSIRIVLTRSALQFLQGQSEEQPSLGKLSQYPNVDGLYLDENEWAIPWTRNAPILHIELRRWADAFLIAPLSANTLAKIANGLCDNLLTSVVRAWDSQPRGYENVPAANSDRPSYSPRKIIVAPAMNTLMWRNPFTEKHLESLKLVDTEVLRPVEKELACGDTGDGAMQDWKVIVERLLEDIRERHKRHVGR